MSKAVVCLTIATVVGGILFIQFLMEIWDKDFEDRNKGDFHY